MVTVEKYHSALHFRWKKAKKSVNFICCRPPGGKCRSSRSGGGRPRTPLGPLPTGLLKPSKVLVTNSRDRGSEVEGKIRNLRRSKVPPLTEKSCFGKDLPRNHLEVWNREGCNLVAVVPTTVHRREGSSNSSSGQPLQQQTA